MLSTCTWNSAYMRALSNHSAARPYSMYLAICIALHPTKLSLLCEMTATCQQHCYTRTLHHIRPCAAALHIQAHTSKIPRTPHRCTLNCPNSYQAHTCHIPAHNCTLYDSTADPAPHLSSTQIHNIWHPEQPDSCSCALSCHQTDDSSTHCFPVYL